MFREALSAMGVPMRGQSREPKANDRRLSYEPPEPGPSGLSGAFDGLPAGRAFKGLGLTPEDCEFLFLGGAGVSGDYLDGFKRAFEEAGIENVRVPKEHVALGVDAARMAGDLFGLPGTNDLAFARSLVGKPEIQAAARHAMELGDEQYNLGGYSFGGAAAAANAYAIAEQGGEVDNLVLVGAPINRDLYDAVKSHPRIKQVVEVDLGEHGDPIHAGMSDGAFVRAFPQVAGQMRGNEGHFYYSGDNAEGQKRRDALATTLTGYGLR